MAGLSLPPQLAGLLPGGGPAPTPPGMGPTEPDQDDGGLSCVQDTINYFPKLLHELSDPTDVQDAVKALQLLVGIQKRLMTGSGQGGPQPQSQ